LHPDIGFSGRVIHHVVVRTGIDLKAAPSRRGCFFLALLAFSALP
jgi:hypothetical protein